MSLRLFAFALTLFTAGCAGLQAEPQPITPPMVVMISIDGFRFDYLERGLTPTLASLAENGSIGPMRPSFPSVTFPNHYTLATGLHPDHHGVVGNTMVDAELGRFTPRTTSAVADRRWWDQGEPIWVSAEKADLVTAVLFWPGSEADIHGVRPTHWRPYDQSVSSAARVDQVLEWLDLPASQRPDLTALYLDAVDTAGHHNGPISLATDQALGEVDASISRLIEGIRTRGLYDQVTLVIVSDHGMAAISPDRVTWLEDLVDPSAVELISSGSIAFFNLLPGRETEAESALLAEHAHLECWRKADLPSRFIFGSNSRVPAIICLSESGWVLATRARPLGDDRGAHGYDNAAPEMTALFIAHGPLINPGRQLDSLDSVDVQPFVGALLGIDVPTTDGSLDDTRPAMRSADHAH
jgi:predicted AlkP superfamily pyrophosphatase or phosphodiesterase